MLHVMLPIIHGTLCYPFRMVRYVPHGMLHITIYITLYITLHDMLHKIFYLTTCTARRYTNTRQLIYENMQMQRGQSLDGLAYDRLLKSYIKVGTPNTVS